MDDPGVRDVPQGTTPPELSPYAIEQAIVVPTASIVRIDSGADAPRSGIVQRRKTGH